jgi:hypothetical protein
LKKENSLGKNGKIDSIQFFSLGKLMMMKIVKINVRKGRKRSPGYMKDKKENVRKKTLCAKESGSVCRFSPTRGWVQVRVQSRLNPFSRGGGLFFPLLMRKYEMVELSLFGRD